MRENEFLKDVEIRLFDIEKNEFCLEVIDVSIAHLFYSNKLKNLIYFEGTTNIEGDSLYFGRVLCNEFKAQPPLVIKNSYKNFSIVEDLVLCDIDISNECHIKSAIEFLNFIETIKLNIKYIQDVSIREILKYTDVNIWWQQLTGNDISNGGAFLDPMKTSLIPDSKNNFISIVSRLMSEFRDVKEVYEVSNNVISLIEKMPFYCIINEDSSLLDGEIVVHNSNLCYLKHVLLHGITTIWAVPLECNADEKIVYSNGNLHDTGDDEMWETRKVNELNNVVLIKNMSDSELIKSMVHFKSLSKTYLNSKCIGDYEIELTENGRGFINEKIAVKGECLFEDTYSSISECAFNGANYGQHNFEGFGKLNYEKHHYGKTRQIFADFIVKADDETLKRIKLMNEVLG